jgi:UDP-glucuronate 4-epimerase
VICLDNFDPYYDPARKRQNIAAQLTHPNYVLVEGDICDRELVMAAFAEYHFDRVAHLAALAGVRASVERAALYAQVNLGGSINVLDAAHQSGVANFVQASTSSIYGDTDQVPFREDQPADHPLAPYPATKKASEVMCYAYHHLFGMNINVLRFFTAYGPRVRPDMMVYQVMDSIIHDRKITLFEPEVMRRDWTYIEDIIEGVIAGLDRPLGYEVLNIGRGEPVNLGEFVDIIEGLTGQRARIKTASAPPSEPHVTFASIEKARRLIGYQPHVPIQDGLGRTWAWYQTLPESTQPAAGT